MMFNRFILPFLICALNLFEVHCQSSSDWSYDGLNGPDYWCELPLEGNQCCGSRQSPIDIDTSTTVKSDIQFELNGLDYSWDYVNLTNDKHTVVARVPQDSLNRPSVVLRLNGEITSDTYIFDSLHFHFGKNDSVGSEHTIDGDISPMEMHTIFYNDKYPSFTDAKLHPDGVIVFGTQFYISRFDNKDYNALVSGLQSVIYVDQSVTISPGFAIIDLLPGDLFSAYSYEGSLTTPTCNEVVQWIVFKARVPISEDQMTGFRNLTIIDQPQPPIVIVREDGDMLMSNNYRPVQPLNGRTISTVKHYLG